MWNSLTHDLVEKETLDRFSPIFSDGKEEHLSNCQTSSSSQAREGCRKSNLCFGLWATLTNLPHLPLDVRFLKVRAEDVEDFPKRLRHLVRNVCDVEVCVVVPPDDFLFLFIVHNRITARSIKSSYCWRSSILDILLHSYMSSVLLSWLP